MPCIVDFRVALGSVILESLRELTESGEIPSMILRIPRVEYWSTVTPARIYYEELLEFGIHSMMRQGCPLSPVSFCYAINRTVSIVGIERLFRMDDPRFDGTTN